MRHETPGHGGAGWSVFPSFSLRHRPDVAEGPQPGHGYDELRHLPLVMMVGALALVVLLAAWRQSLDRTESVALLMGYQSSLP